MRRLLQYWNGYAKEQRKYWLGGMILAGLFYVTAVLNQLPQAGAQMSYALALALFFFVCQTAFSYRRYYRKQEALRHVALQPEACMEELPPADGLTEERYQELLRQVVEEQRRLVTGQESSRQDMMDYYSMWVHQIKTPIAALHLLLERDGVTGAHAMEEELFKIEQYTDMALHYVRLERMSSDLALKEYEIDGLIRGAVRKSSVLFIGSGLSLEVEETGIRAVTDEKWFSFLVEQLLSNAVKYTREGSVRICREDGRSIAVKDTGIGIPAGDLPRIFERGFTGYNGRIYRKSTGIGLYLCRQAAAGLGIALTARSVPGEGTTMILRFPEQP